MATQVVISSVAGAGFQMIFGDFIKVVFEALKNNSQFKPSLKRLADMLEEMAPSIKRIESFNIELDQPKQLEGLKGLMKKGNDLVSKCSKIHKYNYYQRPLYNKKLLKLGKDIRDHITRLQLQVVADTKEILHTQNSTLVSVEGVSSEVRQLNDQIGKLSMTLSNGDWVDSSKSYSNTILAGVCSPPLLKVDPVGLEIPLNDLRIKLLNDETSQHIVLSAPGGCGKTTLATALCQHGNVKDKFKSNIFFVTVPKLRNLMVIVKMIFQHKEIELPDFRSEEDAANHLERLFQQIGPDPILLVLDDVWPGSQSILDKLKFRIENYKILVTSRYEFPSFGSTYKLKTLNLADAMTLFQKLAFPLDQQSNAPDQQILEEMVKYCRGFPLVISVVGKSLCRKSPAEWRKRHRECSKPASILSDNEILDCLQSSVEALNDDVVAKECFMDLGSFPEDQRIPATTLIDMWAELYNLDEDNAIANLHELSDRNLIEVVVTRKDANEDDGSYNEHFVTQHDLLRELAIRGSNSGNIEHRKRVLLEIIENKIPEWLMEQDQLSIRAKLLSISTDEKFSSSWSTMQAPEVEVLLLNFRTEKFSLPEFIERMNKLKVLVLHNYGFVPAELSNFPLLGSLSNLKRIRLEKVSIPSLFLTSMKWRKLEKMSLVMCNIDQAFNKSTNKISDAFPKLVDLTIDYCNDLEELPTGFCDLVLLRKLSITNCHKLLALPEDMGNLLDLEVLRLNSCIELTGLPGTIGRLHKLQILDLSECLSVTELPEQIGQLHDLRKLYMIECSSCELPSSVANLVRLKEVIGDQETAMSWNRFKPCLPSLTIKSNIFFVNVPKLRNLMIIVKMIFQHKEIESPDFRSEEDAANHLERLFMQIGPDPILLVLDDVWPVSESILDMLKFRIENFKILVTSRYEFQSFGSTYKLKTLNPADAMTLFQKLALPRDQQSYAPDQQILEEMVKYCRGFPLVISVVGKSLCRKSAAEWRKRLRECSKAVSILSDYEKILDCLQSSVEAFDDDVVAKECFMDLGSFPEDERIPATTLIDMWAELYDLDEDDAIANVHKLSEMNLIEVVVTRKDANEDDGSYNEHFVTQHDLLRELAIRESNSRSIEHRKRVLLEIIENKIPEWLMEQDQLSMRAKLLSISTELPEQIGQLHDLRKLYMIECSSCELPSSVDNLFRLKEVIGDQETAMSWNRFKPCLPSLTIKHDLLRELAIHQSDLEPMEQRKRQVMEICANNVPDWWMEQKQPSISSRLLSISTDDNISSSCCSMQAPEVEVMILNCRA
ncbi:hypothetical protein NC651_018005 [Populus alba x Populus x berolinensis]|nr:hypothetical protein NC651_018005 [Populus alba x Populus x berolinensis]